jgi:hypothetical protein
MKRSIGAAMIQYSLSFACRELSGLLPCIDFFWKNWCHSWSMFHRFSENRRAYHMSVALVLGLVSGVVGSLGYASDVHANAACCRYVVSGCGRDANVCVQESCQSGAETKARKAFENAYKCKSHRVSSHIGTCTNERCDLKI